MVSRSLVLGYHGCDESQAGRKTADNRPAGVEAGAKNREVFWNNSLDAPGADFVKESHDLKIKQG